jgi:hypothetical protein
MGVTLGMFGNSSGCSCVWAVASLLLDMLFSRWTKGFFFFFLRLSTASREFWDTEGGRLNRFPLEETILWAFASFFYNIFIFSYYNSLDPFGLELFLGVIV